MLTVFFRKDLVLYIQYNNYNEYSYQIAFSMKKFDRIRYDNYDDRWDVKTKPHHMHMRKEKTAVESPMIGDPQKDMPILIKKLKELF